jgi:hypothetical protein
MQRARLKKSLADADLCPSQVNYTTLHAFGVLRVGLVRELGLKPIGVGGKSALRFQRSRL